MDHETKLLDDTFTKYKSQLKAALKCTLPNPKDSEASEKVRREGNALYQQSKHSFGLHKEILGLYNRSAALAPSGSPELATAYGNRSAFLFHIGKYGECIQDIDKALEITKSIELKVKLLCRKVECCKNLGIDDCSSIIEEAQYLVDAIDDCNRNKKMLKKKIYQVAKFVAKKLPEIQETIQGIDLPVTDNMLEKVSIRHNEKYGRHLVAEQNYNPGDIIFVEKLFAISTKPINRYTNCHHCLKTCFNGVPCEHCDWVIFCSEECNQRAWQEYHHIECSVGHLLNNVLDNWDPCSLSIKIFISAIQDAGSIENLRTHLEAVDKCTDVSYRGFYKNGKFTPNTLESYYSLTQKKLSASEKEFIPVIALMVLIGLLKHPQMMNIFHIKKIEDFICNKDMDFLGSLFIKFTAIGLNNSFSFIHFTEIDDISRGVPKDPRGTCIALLMSLANNSCCPNAHFCVTEDGKIILYALQPIEKNSQIFHTYSQEYQSAPLKYRKECIQPYDFNCDCQACAESWPTVLLNYHLLQRQGKNYEFDDSEAAFRRQCIDESRTVEDGYSKATFEKLSSKITLAFQTLKQPSTFTCVMQESLKACFTIIYNGLKPQLIQICKKMK